MVQLWGPKGAPPAVSGVLIPANYLPLLPGAKGLRDETAAYRTEGLRVESRKRKSPQLRPKFLVKVHVKGPQRLSEQMGPDRYRGEAPKHYFTHVSHFNSFLRLMASISLPLPKSRGSSLAVYNGEHSRCAFWEMKFDSFDEPCSLEELRNLGETNQWLLRRITIEMVYGKCSS